MILLIDNNDSFTYNIVEILHQITDKEVHSIKKEEFNLRKVAPYEKFIFSPGPGLPPDFPSMGAILDHYKTAKPILGICLGHQAICEYFGAKIERLDNVLHGIDSIIKCDSNSHLFKNKNSMVVGRYHSWIARNIPVELNITATDSEGNVMAVEHSSLPIYGVQFHPESHISLDGVSILENFINGDI